MDKRLFFLLLKEIESLYRKFYQESFQNQAIFLEIGSGSGEHGVAFQKCFPEITWQSSDPETIHRNSISSWIEYEKLKLKNASTIRY